MAREHEFPLCPSEDSTKIADSPGFVVQSIVLSFQPMQRVPPGFFATNISEIVVAIFDTIFLAARRIYAFAWGLKFLLWPLIARLLTLTILAVSVVEVFKDVDVVKVHLQTGISWIHTAWIHNNFRLLDDYLHRLASYLAPLWAPLFFVLAAGMAVHHHKMMRRVRRSEKLVGSLRYCAVQGSDLIAKIANLGRSAIPAATGQEQSALLQGQRAFVEAALENLTSSLTPHEIAFYLPASWRFPWFKLVQPFRGFQRQVFASVWERNAQDRSILKFWCDSPSGTYNDLPQIPMNSAAGCALEDCKLLYVPRTRFLDGFKMIVPKEGHRIIPAYDSFEFRKNAYIKFKTRHMPKATISIPVTSLCSSQYVLCLDSTKGNYFREIDFQAVCLLANVIGIVLTETEKAISELQRG